MTAFLFNGTKQIIDLNGSAGALIAILATGPLRRFKITESLVTSAGVANTPQGLQYTIPGSAKTFYLPAPSTTNEPSEFPAIEVPDRDDASFHAAFGNVLGNGPDTPGAGVAPTLATTLCSVKSLTGTGTSVEVTQIY